MYSEFDEAVEAYRKAQGAFVQGDARPVLELFSRREDASLANPLGPPAVGPEAVERAALAAAAVLRDGVIDGYEVVSRCVSDDLGYVVQIERGQARFPGSETMNPIALRATMIFRREEDGWKVVHRHADPITTARPIDSVVAT